MKVILNSTSEIKDVSFGYAVNYLIPKGLAVRATDKNLKELEIKRSKEKEKKDQQADEAGRLFSQFSGHEFIIRAKAGKKGKLHGVITKKDLAKELKLVKDNLILPEPIKKLGEYSVELKFGDKRAKVRVRVEEEK